MHPSEYQHRLRTPEAAAFLGLSRSTMEKLRLTGGGPRYAKLGKIVTYAPADLAAWAEARTRTSTSEQARGA
jgi:predicted DNA-binding transcriptional regulator AlpA